MFWNYDAIRRKHNKHILNKEAIRFMHKQQNKSIHVFAYRAPCARTLFKD
jgi:hypothetical protein